MLPFIFTIGFISAVYGAFYDKSGKAMLNGQITQTEEFGWSYVDHQDTFNYSGSALLNKQGSPGTCGLTLIRSWDIKGQNLSVLPPADYKAIAVSSGRCWIDTKKSKMVIHRNVEYSEALGFDITDISFRHYRTRRSNPINLFVNPNRVLFSLVDGIDIAIIELKETVAELLQQDLQFYPIESAPLKNDTAVTAIAQFDATFSQTYYMRYTIFSYFKYYATYTGSDRVENYPNIYGFAHTCTTPGYGAPIFIANSTKTRRLFGVSTEYETSTTLNYGTSLAQLIDCFTPNGQFTLVPEGCLRELKLDLFKRRTVQLEGFKYLTRNVSTTTNSTVLYASSNTTVATFDLDALFPKSAEFQDTIKV